MQLGFVPRGGVLLDDPKLCGTVDDGKCAGQQLERARGILRRNQAAHGPHLVTQLRGIAAVVIRSPFRLSYAL